MMLKRNLRTLLDVVFRAGIASGDVTEEPDYKLEFNPLWSLSDTEQATVDQTKAQTALVKAQTAQAYVDMQALDPTEVRRRLASDEEFDVEDIISEDDEDDLLQSLLGTEPSTMSDVEAAQKNIEQGQAPGGEEQSATVAPTATPPTTNADAAEDENWVTINGTHVLIDENGVAQGGGKLKGMSFKDAKSQKGYSSETKSTAFSPATKGLDESYTGSLDAARKFNKQLYESHPEAFGSEDVFDENCRAVYDKRFGSVKFLYENAEGEEKNLYKKVSFEEWKKMDFEDQSHSYVDYDDFKKSYTDYYNEYAEKGSVVDGLNIYHNGAAKTGYGKAKGARKELDEKYGLSKFIDDNPDIHYSGGTLYRGVKSNASQVKQIQKALESGGTIDMRGCSSWTTQEYIAKDFCDNSLKGSASAKHVVFIEEGNKERNAMPYPYSSTGFMIQNEVLYSGTAKFKPVKAEEKDGTMYVYVESE